jgi:hypothetical protein
MSVVLVAVGLLAVGKILFLGVVEAGVLGGGPKP